MAENTTISSQIFLSRDQIRLQIIEYLKTYLEIENVDLTKSSFLSFIVNILSTLTSNLMFYEASVYKEFFLTTAQLPDSILNLASFLGYNTTEATYSEVDLLVTVPLKFTDNIVNFIIPQNFKFYAGTMQFVTYYTTQINVTNNNNVTIVVQEEDRIYNLPVSIDTTSTMSFSFVMHVKQVKQTPQQFQVDADLKAFQFFTIDVPIPGKLESMIVSITDPTGTSTQVYQEFSSLYLMSPTDFGYVSRKTAKGRRLFFGNGLIGVQPLPGSTVNILVNETEGLNGNVIAGSIARGDRIYFTPISSAQTKIVDYTVVNPSGATGGTDEESLEEVRSNAIIGLTSLGRLVSEMDYSNANYIVPFASMALNPIAVLKRSDVKVNEIQLYMPLTFNNTLVPTRNEKIQTTNDITFIPRGTIIIDAVLMEYITLFDITIDYLNDIANYNYIMTEVQEVLSLITSYGSTYSISIGELNISKSGLIAAFDVPYYSTEADASVTDCTMEILESGQTFLMTNDPTDKKYTYTFPDYTTIPEGELTFLFTINYLSGLIATYSCKSTFRRSLRDFMMSNVKIDGTSVVVFDIPVVEKTYYDFVNKKQFEQFILQDLITNMTTAQYRMITDFTNAKFVNTYGQMQNMKYNKVTKADVIDLVSAPPTNVKLGDRFIIRNPTYDPWIGNSGSIVQLSDSTAVLWTYTNPITNDTVYVSNLGNNYLYNGENWVLPRFTCPIQIKAEVFKKETFVGSDTELITNIKNALVQVFRPRFGPNVSLYRSEITRVVQSIEGVDHCQLLFPTSDIFFNFNISTDLTQQQLLEYSPEYVYFTVSDISITTI